MKFVQVWKGFTPDNFFLSLLNVKPMDNIVVFCWPSGQYEKKPGEFVILYSGESGPYRFRDYNITFLPTNREGPHPNIQLRNYERLHIEKKLSIGPYSHLEKSRARRIRQPKTRFCAFISRHGLCQMRNQIFEQLSKYKKVDSLGEYKHNVDFPVPPYNPLDPTIWDEYLDLLSTYKFVICFENKSEDHYLTEKLYTALESGSVPVYWGAPQADEVFNPASFIWLNKENTMENVLRLIQWWDQDEAGYQTILNAPPLAANCTKMDREFESRVDMIRSLISTPALQLVSKLKVLRTNDVYRIGAVILGHGDRWQRDRTTILSDPKYQNTILYTYLKHKRYEHDFGTLRYIMRRWRVHRPAAKEIVIHIRAGDAVVFDWFMKQNYVSHIKGFIANGANKITIVSALHYGNFVELNRWMYSDESRDRNFDAFERLFTKLHREFPNIPIDVKSGTPDEDFVYLFSATYLIYDCGGFSKCMINARNAKEEDLRFPLPTPSDQAAIMSVPKPTSPNRPVTKPTSSAQPVVKPTPTPPVVKPTPPVVKPTPAQPVTKPTPELKGTYSQIGQDLHVLAHFKNRKDGYFVDVGAFDGMNISNTYLLEKKYGWKGICCEPNPEKFKLLTERRNCICRSEAVYSIPGLMIDFACAEGLSGIPEHQDTPLQAHQEKIKQAPIIKVPTQSLTKILDESNAPRTIQYLSLDTEGSELEVLKSIDFNKYVFEFISVEHNYTNPRRGQMKKFLESKGYRYLRANQWDDYYVCDSLHRLAIKHGTDKHNSVHTYKGESYLHVYERYFTPIRYKVRTIVEIGILSGCSLRLWREYFPNAQIYGIDINPTCKAHAGDRIHVYIGDQNDEEFLTRVKDELGQIDILIDDGSHITRHQIKTYNILSPIVKYHYIIEDLRCSYEEILNRHDVRKIWPGMMHNDPKDPLKNYRSEFDTFLHSQVKQLDMLKQSCRIRAVHHHPMIVNFELIPHDPIAELHQAGKKIHFTSFGNTAFKNSRERIAREAAEINVFDSIHVWNEVELSNTPFGKKHNIFMQTNPRGYGYYIWKPYVVKDLLDRINDGDVMVYCDAGCEIVKEHRDRLLDYISAAMGSNYGMLTFQTNHQLSHYCKADLAARMDFHTINYIWNNKIHVAGILVIRKCNHTTRLVDKWLQIAEENYHNIDNTPSTIPNDPKFAEHRHDQAILTGLIYKHKTATRPNRNETHPPRTGPLSASRIRE